MPRHRPKSNHDSNQSRLSLLQGMARGNKKRLDLVGAAREILPVGQHLRGLQWLRDNRYVRQFPPRRTAVHVHDLIPAPSPTPMTLAREVSWASAVLSCAGEELAEYISQRNALELPIALRDSLPIGPILDSIQHRYGYSLWILARRVSYLQLTGGLDAQKAYTRRIVDLKDSGGLPRFAAYWLSLVNDENISHARLNADLARNISATPSDLRNYLAFVFGGLYPATEDGLSDVLRNASLGTLIDYYETFLQVLPAVATTAPRLRQLVDNSYELLSGTIADERLLRARSKNTGSPRTVLDGLTSILLDKTPRDEMTLRLDESQLGQQLRSVLNREPSLVDDAAALRKVYLSARGMEWAEAIPALMDGLLDPTARPWHLASVQRQKCLGSARRLISLMDRIPKEGTSDRELEPPTEMVAILAAIQGAATQLESDLAPSALETFQKPISEREPFRSMALSIRIQHGIAQRDWSLVLQSLTDVLLASGYLAPVLPLREIAQTLDQSTRATLIADLNLSVALHLLHTNGVSEDESFHRYACEDYLLAYNCGKPSDLKAVDLLKNSFLRAQFRYFLHSVCTEGNIDTFLALSTSRDVLEERVRILQWLTELDQQNAPLYATELREVLTRLQVRQRMREIEQTKIYLDTEAVRRRAVAEIEDHYTRFVALLDLTIAQHQGLPRKVAINRALAAELKRAYIDNPNRSVKTIDAIVIPPSEIVSLLEEMLARIRDDYVSNTNYGLDGYLSVRIRHGTLSGQLRSPVEKHHLVTQRKPDGTGYEPNRYWDERLADETVEAQKQAAEYLRKFSLEYDNLISEVATQWIRIRTTRQDSGAGYFDFTLSIHDLVDISSALERDLPVEKFVERTIAYLGLRLDVALDSLRGALAGTLKPRLVELLHSLEMELDEALLAHEKRFLLNSIREARVDVQRAVDRASNWFVRDAAAKGAPFEAGDALTLAREVAKTLYPQLGVETDVRYQINPVPLFAGEHLAPVVDILFTLLHNVVRHSGCENPRASIVAEYERDAVVFSVENEVDSRALTPDAESRFLAVRAALQGTEASGYVAKEGGTGFLKIKKILAHDIGGTPILEVSLNGRVFRATFSIRNTRKGASS